MQEAHRALEKAKIALMSRRDSAFFTTVAFSLKHVWDEKIPTACTDGTQIRYNPAFFMSLNTEEQVFLLLHESMHVAYLHMDRLQTRNPRKWNIAADYVINLQLVERGFKMPKMGLLDYQYKGMSTEQVYDRITDEQAKQQEVMLDLEPNDIPSDELQREVEDILVRASIQSKMQNDKAGTIPGDIEIFINRLLNPKLPWNQILRKFMNTLQRNDYSWRRFNRRFFPQFYLPSLYSEGINRLAIAVDSSGSVSDEDFNQFVSETHTILKSFTPKAIDLIQFDAKIQSVDTVRNVRELMNVHFTGRGYTLIGPVLDWAEENQPEALLVFTDGYFNFSPYTPNPSMPVIWLIHNNPDFSPPFGKVIHYELEHSS